MYNICIPNAQNCELSAPGNLWCEIREFWACSFILLIYRVLCGSERKCAGFSTAKVAFSFAVEPLLHPHTSTFARQYCHYCLTIQPQSYCISGAIALLDGCGRCENAKNDFWSLYNQNYFCNRLLPLVRYLHVVSLGLRRLGCYRKPSACSTCYGTGSCLDWRLSIRRALHFNQQSIVVARQSRPPQHDCCRLSGRTSAAQTEV